MTLRGGAGKQQTPAVDVDYWRQEQGHRGGERAAQGRSEVSQPHPKPQEEGQHKPQEEGQQQQQLEEEEEEYNELVGDGPTVSFGPWTEGWNEPEAALLTSADGDAFTELTDLLAEDSSGDEAPTQQEVEATASAMWTTTATAGRATTAVWNRPAGLSKLKGVHSHNEALDRNDAGSGDDDDDDDGGGPSLNCNSRATFALRSICACVAGTFIG